MFGDLKGYELLEMLVDAGREGLNDEQRAAIGYISVAGMLAPQLNDQHLLAAAVAMDPAYTSLPIVGVGNACDSGGLALLDAAKTVRCGDTHVALAIGVEKMNIKKPGKDGKPPKTDSIKIGQMLGTAAHPDDRFPPFSFPHLFARIMNMYMERYGISEEQLAILPPYLYANAAYNPLAHMRTPRNPITVESVLSSYRLFQKDGETGEGEDLPLKLEECSQISDGYSRFVVCDEEGLSMLGLTKDDVTVLAGWGHAVDGLSIASRGDNVLQPVGAKKAFVEALRMSKIPPECIGVLETHDCFSIMLPLTAEIAGLAEPGQGLPYFVDHMMGIDSDLPTNTSGGLMAKGHPISATGLALAGWVHQQILGQVPVELKVSNCENGISLNIGGPIASTVCLAQYRA
ncbi:thiolase family protein [Patescibacteria group bacterium]|nr:thiolase family protein [Patescibacteria group bacterium]